MWVKPQFPDTSSPDKEYNLLSKGGYVSEHPNEKGNRRAEAYGFGFKLRPEDDSMVALDMATANGGIYISTNIFSYESGWQHLVISSRENSGASEGINYINTSDETYEPAPLSNIFVGGKFLTPMGNHFKGQIAELRIWNRTLSLDEIAEFKTIALTGNEPNLVGCWTFEEGEGSFARDISPYKNRARLGSSYAADKSDPTWVRIGVEKENVKNPAVQVEAETEKQELSVFESYFPDDPEAGKKLDEWWPNKDSSYLDTDAFFELFRKGLRRSTVQYKGNFLMQHIGGKYIWHKGPDDKRAVDIVYHASFSPEYKYYAVYSGLSVANPKSERFVKRLVEMALDETNDFGRISWGLSHGADKEIIKKYLVPYLDSESKKDELARQLYREIFEEEPHTSK